MWQSSILHSPGAVLLQGPRGMNLPEDQCVFVRGFRVARTLRILPKHLKAAAGPSLGPEEDDCEPGVELVSIPSVAQYRDPLHQIIDYVSERTPDCDMVLVHDDDLAKVDGIGDGILWENLQHGVVSDLLQNSDKQVHMASCDLSPVSSSPNTNTDPAVIKVAMLSTELQNRSSASVTASQQGQSQQSQSQQDQSQGHNNNTRTIAEDPFPIPPQQYGAPALNAASVRSVVTPASVSHGSASLQRPPISPTVPTASNVIGSVSSYDRYRAHQSSPPPPNASRPAEERSLAGLGSSRNNPPSPPSPIVTVNSQKNCIIPGCPYPVYYNYADQEQTEYCDQDHELDAVTTGFMDTCVMCKGRPRRTGERVCGRTCRERAREARPVQGTYYGARTIRYGAQTRSGRMF